MRVGGEVQKWSRLQDVVQNSANSSKKETNSEINPISESIEEIKGSDMLKSYAPSTRSWYYATLDSLEEFCMQRGVEKLSDLDDKTKSKWVAQLPKDEPSRARRYKTILNLVDKWQAVKDLHRINPDVDNILSSDQIARLLGKTNSLRDVALITLGLETGALLPELLRLDGGSVDISDKENSIIYFPESIHANHRYVPISREIAEFLEKIFKLESIGDERHLFRKNDSERLGKAEAENILKRAGEKTGITNLTFSDLRKTFINNFKGTESQLFKALGLSK